MCIVLVCVESCGSACVVAIPDNCVCVCHVFTVVNKPIHQGEGSEVAGKLPTSISGLGGQEGGVIW